MNYKVESFYHKDTCTWTHLFICINSGQAVLIDPVLDFNPNNGKTGSNSIDLILNYISKHELIIKYILETHAHADHITAADYIKSKTGAKTVIGHNIPSVQAVFKKVFNLGDDFKEDGSQFDILLKNNDALYFGECEVLALHTPGHTDDSMSYVIEDCVFIGDTLFSPDYGSARCDFPGGDSEKLYDSIMKIYSLGEKMKLYLCHDYPPKFRNPEPMFVSGDQQKYNKHINKKTNKNTFVKMRDKRDLMLDQPRLIIPAIQVNISSGKFPVPENNGKIYLKTPINVLGDELE